ncbi:mevalonate kinase [Microthyrium microscopicum]|uniref:Mevalonate kinase n=1 Tax=Microthyrium microscopicum TaxID=703497 RepID=A0A6A6UFN9_9PEZI|nr:mevalonate kinase [Microthyrium microscopicum]
MTSSPSRSNGARKSLVNGVIDSDRPGIARKSSNPLLPSFMVSAPGKVIVYGEHAVVYGKAAIAAAISLRSYLHVTFLSKSKRTVRLIFPDIGLDQSWNIDDLPWKVFSAPGKKKNYTDRVTSLDQDLLDSLQPHIISVSASKPEATRKLHQNSATTFLYLFLSLGSIKSPPCIYTLRSTIPIGAGLGSSATISVCLSAALLLQIRALSGPHDDQPSEESQIQIDRINHWAYVGELCIHGSPSGVDNTVSAGGKAVLFRRLDYNKPPSVIPLREFPELPLLLVNTRQSRSTSAQVGRVAKFREEKPKIANHILDSVHEVTMDAHRMLTSEDFDPEDPQTLENLGELISVNHGLLVALRMSHPRLERIRELIDHAGIGWTKLTGAGGGGCAITLLKPSALVETPSSIPNGTTKPTHSKSSSTSKATQRARSGSLALQNMQSQLSSENYEIFSTTLGGDGVGVLWPAVLHNNSGEEGGEEIDQEKFLNAVGNDGIERLVGVQQTSSYSREGSEAVREGWKFWRP